jgi:tRNA splicing ligase
LILDNRPHLRDKAQKEEWDESDKRHGLDPTKAVRANTLIVLPTVALRQWQMEIARFTEEGSLTVKVYHGSNRSTTIQDIKAADVVLTSYQVKWKVVGSEHCCTVVSMYHCISVTRLVCSHYQSTNYQYLHTDIGD